MNSKKIDEAMNEVTRLAQDLNAFFALNNLPVPVCLAAMSVLMTSVAIEEPDLDVLGLLDATAERIKRSKYDG